MSDKLVDDLVIVIDGIFNDTSDTMTETIRQTILEYWKNFYTEEVMKKEKIRLSRLNKLGLISELTHCIERNRWGQLLQPKGRSL